MEIISLKCNSCGSDLEVNENTKFFNCSFCGSSLALKKTGNAIYTEVLDEIKGNTEAILDTSEKLLLEKQIDRLDREWEKESETYDDLKDEKSHPLGMVIGGITFIILVGAIGNQNEYMMNEPLTVFRILPVIMGIFGALILIAGIYSLITRGTSIREYEKKELEYEYKRKLLLNKIEEID